jgi:hypothetical protein
LHKRKNIHMIGGMGETAEFLEIMGIGEDGIYYTTEAEAEEEEKDRRIEAAKRAAATRKAKRSAPKGPRSPKAGR